MVARTTELSVDVDGPVARLTLDRTDRANALSPSLLDSLEDTIAECAGRPEVRVVIVAGAGKGFSGGYDIGTPGPDPDVATDLDRLRAVTDRWLRLRDAPIPTIAEVHGYCIAGGLELMLSCDFAVAADDARLGFPPVRAQGVPTVTVYPWLMRMHDVKELLWTGDLVSGARAAEIGLVSRAVPAEDLRDTTEALARRIAACPPELIALSKRSLHRSQDAMGFRTAVQFGAEYDALAHRTAPAERFRSIAREQGVGAAVRWRDEGFTE
jgi:enoyl-CoA hydratase